MTKIIKGQFGPKKPLAGNPNPGDPRQPDPPTYQGVDLAKPGDDQTVARLVGPDGKDIPLTPDQFKALKLILVGTTFVFIAIKPTDRGADFFTALHGDHSELRNVQDELPAVIARLYSKKGVTS